MNSTADSPSLQNLLNRPLDQRRREFQYRFAQSLVFGIPVLVLQFLGSHLGGSIAERQRWIGILQALLTGWVTYIGATGLLFEGILILKRKLTGDFVIGALAMAIYITSLISLIMMLIGRAGILLFHIEILLIVIYSGLRWLMLRAPATSIDPAAR